MNTPFRAAPASPAEAEPGPGTTPNWLIEQYGPADADGTWGGLSLADMTHDFAPAVEDEEDPSDMTVRERFGYGRPFNALSEWGTW